MQNIYNLNKIYDRMIYVINKNDLGVVMFKQVSKIKYLLILLAFVLMALCVPTSTYVLAETTTTQNNVKVENNAVAVLEDGAGEEPDATGKNEGASEGQTPQTPTPPASLGAPVLNDQDGINDVYLYQYLLQTYNNYYGLTDLRHETETTSDDPATQLYVEMFKDFTEISLTHTNALIKSVKGLKVLNLENLKVLNLGQNQISEIDVEDLKNLNSLEELILYDNELTTLTIPSGLTHLRVVNLNKNKLTSFDASLINSGEVYLSFNRIASIQDVKLPRIIYSTNLYVELFNNNITDADTTYLAGLTNEAKIKLELGLQGYGLNYKANEQNVATPVICKANKLKFYNSLKYPNLKANIYSNADNALVKGIVNNTESNITEISLEVGEYRVEFVDATSGNSLYDYTDEFNCAFKTHNAFKIVPTSPVVKFVIKGTEYDNYGKFSGTGKLVATNQDEVGEIYYSISGSEWIKGNEVTLNRGGQYNVEFKCVVGDISSDSAYESAPVIKMVTQSLNPYIPDVVSLIILIALALVLFFVVLPLLVKVIKR